MPFKRRGTKTGFSSPRVRRVEAILGACGPTYGAEERRGPPGSWTPRAGRASYLLSAVALGAGRPGDLQTAHLVALEREARGVGDGRRGEPQVGAREGAGGGPRTPGPWAIGSPGPDGGTDLGGTQEAPNPKALGRFWEDQGYTLAGGGKDDTAPDQAPLMLVWGTAIMSVSSCALKGRLCRGLAGWEEPAPHRPPAPSPGASTLIHLACAAK